jgi:enterochelin esterase-like enzyme
MRFFRLVASAATAFLLGATSAQDTEDRSGLQFQLSIADGLVNSTINGRVVLLLSPPGTDPLGDIDVSSSPDKFYGKNVNNISSSGIVTLAGGDSINTQTGVFGFPNVTLDDVNPGAYRAQAFLTTYQTVTRSDGSTVSVHFPCGDGAPNVDVVGGLTTSIVDINVTGRDQTIELTFENVTKPAESTGREIGGCSQGNYEDTELLQHVKIRSEKLSEFWNMDMYVGANILLPHGYNKNDPNTRYPVLYSQDHWNGGNGGFYYPEDASFAAAWDNGVIPGADGTADQPTPKLIIVTFRHEAPFYDDSYAVNTANLGPYGDAINDELIPYIDKIFNTVAQPYARIQEGGSTGGWISAASVVFRPDLFGACFSSYPDSLDFHRHQAIPLYENTNAYRSPNGSFIPSIRTYVNNTEFIDATVAQENHWELTFGTSTRSFLQWDIWNAVFGVQSLNGYPLEPWDKVTGEIYPDAVEYWKNMDLSHYITSNWDNSLNLGEVLRNRMFIYVGTHDNYFLNQGVEEFQKSVIAKGGPTWANITITPGATHGGLYQGREIWDYLRLIRTWIDDHAPDGKTPLSQNLTLAASRGNQWDDVIARGGHQAALARQAPPVLRATGTSTTASVGRWDPGVKLEAQWFVDGKPEGEPFEVTSGEQVVFQRPRPDAYELQLRVTGRKRGYEEETRETE